MNIHEGTRRMGHLANIMLTLSLVTLMVSFKFSLALFVGGWLVYGLAHVLEGFGSTPEMRRQPSLHA